jgi:hypothetical protein
MLHELMLEYLFILLIYKPIFPYVISALHFLHCNFVVYFFDLHLMQLTTNFLEDELELFNS